jgi:hypothetical protein
VLFPNTVRALASSGSKSAAPRLGPAGRVLTCGIDRTDLGLQVRCGYDEDLVRAEYAVEFGLARGIAEQWRRAVFAKRGFTEVPASYPALP